MIALTRAPIDVAALGGPAPADGAACTFVGVVRDHNGGRAVRHLEYEAFEEMALDVFRAIAAEIELRFGVRRMAIVHRTGEVALGEPSVVIAAAAPHRGEAFEAARYAIEELKARAPIWKAEEYADGSVWVGAPARPGPAADA